MLHHQVNNHQRDLTKNIRAIFYLRTIAAADPDCAAMNELIAQYLQAIDHHGQCRLLVFSNNLLLHSLTILSLVYNRADFD